MSKQALVQNVRRFGPHRVGLLGSLGMMLLGLVGSVIVFSPPSPELAPLAGVSFVATIIGLIGALVFRSRATQARGKPATLTADESGLSHDGRRIATRDEIRSALVYHRGRSARVHVRRRHLRSPIELEVPSAREGTQVLEALGLDAGRVVANVRASGPSWRHWKWRWLLSALGPFVCMLTAATAGAVIHGPIAAAMALVLSLGILSPLMLLVPGKVTVGADGVLVRWLWQQKFIPLADIASVEETEAGAVFSVIPHRLLIHLKSGKTEEILVGTTRSTWGGKRMGRGYDVAERSAMIVERIQEAQLAASRGRAPDTALVLPPRGSRTTADWLTDLRKMLDPDSYRRQAAPAIDELWRLIEDSTRDASTRAAAAASLGPALNDDGRKRLRIAADATAAPGLRIALEAAAEDDETRLLDALERIDAEAEQTEAESEA